MARLDGTIRNFKGAKMTGHINVTMRMSWWLRARVWLATRIIGLALRMLGVGVEWTEEEA